MHETLTQPQQVLRRDGLHPQRGLRAGAQHTGRREERGDAQGRAVREFNDVAHEGIEGARERLHGVQLQYGHVGSVGASLYAAEILLYLSGDDSDID